MMSYSSTRGQDNKINFVDAMLNGLAKDGGLYVPDKFTKFSKKELKELSTLSYSELAFEITKQFIDSEEISSKEYKEICKKTYGKSFGKDLITYDKLNDNERAVAGEVQVNTVHDKFRDMGITKETVNSAKKAMRDIAKDVKKNN